jgi:hypothetical protein
VIRTRRTTAAAAVVVAVSAGLVACSTSSEPAPLHGVRVRVVQYRSDIAPHQVQLEVVNASEVDVTVASAVLRGAGYSPALRWTGTDDPALVRAGTTVDLPVALTTARCGPPGALEGVLRLADGSTRSVPAEDSHRTLAALRQEGCFAEDAARTATFAFRAFRPEQRGAELDLAVDGGPDAAAGLTVERVLPTTLLSPRGGAETWTVGRRVTGGETVTLTAVPTRCDLHAIAEDKVGTVLPVQLRLADGSRGTVDVRAPAALKDRILAWVVAACGNT